MSRTSHSDKRSGRIVVLSHCLLNVHCLEDGLSLYAGLEEELIRLLMDSGVGLHQIPCPETALSGIFRRALPKKPYEHPKIRQAYRKMAEAEARRIAEYKKKGHTITAVIGAEVSPTCGIDLVGQWKPGSEKEREFPRDIQLVPGRGVFMEELQSVLSARGIEPHWIGVPGKTLRSVRPESFAETLEKLSSVLSVDKSPDRKGMR